MMLVDDTQLSDGAMRDYIRGAVQNPNFQQPDYAMNSANGTMLFPTSTIAEVYKILKGGVSKLGRIMLRAYFLAGDHNKVLSLCRYSSLIDTGMPTPNGALDVEWAMKVPEQRGQDTELPYRIGMAHTLLALQSSQYMGNLNDAPDISDSSSVDHVYDFVKHEYAGLIDMFVAHLDKTTPIQQFIAERGYVIDQQIIREYAESTASALAEGTL